MILKTSTLKYRGFGALALLFVSSFAISACSLDHPTFISQNKIQVAEGTYNDEVALSAFDQGYASALGGYYGRYGDGPVTLTVTYDQKSKTNTAMKAGEELARLKDTLSLYGIKDVRGSIIPVYQSGETSNVLISFDTFNAVMPDDCRVMTGFEDTMLDIDPDYELGCTVNTVISRQVARPKDLLGQDQTESTSDGRRGSNLLEPYHAGVPNEPLGGETASE